MLICVVVEHRGGFLVLFSAPPFFLNNLLVFLICYPLPFPLYYKFLVFGFPEEGVIYARFR